MSDEFYVGYRKVAPPHLARYVRVVAVLVGLCAGAAAIAIGAAQQPAGNGVYASVERERYKGRLLAEPVPHLQVDAQSASSAPRQFLLVARGKHGMPDYARAAIGSRVQLSALPIERDGLRMLELSGPKSFTVLDSSPLAPSSEPNSRSELVTLRGELVDTKCYLGVMNPGRGKVHRGCAAECLRGGVPPGLLVHNSEGKSSVILIHPNAGSINPEWAGRTLEISGYLESSGELRAIRAVKVSLLP